MIWFIVLVVFALAVLGSVIADIADASALKALKEMEDRELVERQRKATEGTHDPNQRCHYCKTIGVRNLGLSRTKSHRFFYCLRCTREFLVRHVEGK